MLTEQSGKKPVAQVISDNLWMSPGLFIAASFVQFSVLKHPGWDRYAWWIYLAGWVPPALMLLWSGARRAKPPQGAPVIFALLAIYGIVTGVLQHDSFPL
ncbi:hypothetical protein J2Z21_008908 [Streptomyces griseochromogenes]|uniref:Uncharacterized protein n=1 Tax=Streptomyces griseochromogenes TaxID=68214 RepID=A0A1B1AZQ8_9ACTN|nr:hypothetical protein [Streptomyces griseochromogenes]ANP52030.1 hypothetical protein AVL59_22825 [Streptomyces griseochromogenes]MBP2055892.1 hypothetical protein [Streptomyces griseochromogenes]